MAIRAHRSIPRWVVAVLAVTALFSLEQVRLWAQACTGLTLTMTDSPDPVNPGSTITYTINLSRSTPLLNATLTDPLPPGVTFQSLVAPAGATCTVPVVGGTGTVSCTFNYDPTRMYGITSTNQLVTFAPSSPGVALSSVAVTGLQPAEVIRGIDVRPATGGLYALGSTSRLYLINPSTGAATQVGSAGAFTLNGTSFGFDFNPVVDRIRVVSDTEQNLRLNPNDGSLSGTDTNLSPAGNVVAAAYANNVAGATATTLYDIDSGIDRLLLQGSVNGTPTSANTGITTQVGPLGVDTSAVVGFDISPSGTAYALLTVGGLSRLHTINLGTGAATLIGSLPSNTFTGIAVGPSVSLDFQFTLTVNATSVTPNAQLTNTVSVSSSSESCFSSATTTTRVACPTITVSPTSLSAGTVGQAYPPTTFTQSGGAGSVTFSTTGTVPPGLTVSSGGGLTGTPTTAGTYDFTVIATDANGCTGSRSYSVTINPTPTLTLTPATANFGVINSAGAISAVTPTQTLTLLQNGPGTVTWTASSDVPWLSVSPASGSGSASILVFITSNPTLLPPPGLASGTVTISAVGAANSPAVNVNLTVLTPDQATAPVGLVDTPLEGQGNITGALPVTGWAIDDVGVTQVKIFRNPVSPENPSQLVFIGDAVFVNGARTDIAAANPTKPLKDQAGWGYLLLTNFLPNQGNGTFTLSAIATDVDGRSTLLGSRTISCTNATATAPFGTIDTPGQGETVSGSAYLNFGWALTPQPKMIPADGSTIQVLIDSVPIGNLTAYNFARSDIQQAFPGYTNTDGAVGYRIFDTTTLSNGVHTIAWIATDNAGIASGLGSRYFTVANGAGSLLAAPNQAGAVVIGGAAPARHTPQAPAAIHHSAVRHVRAVQLERMEVTVGDGARPGVTYRGYQIVGRQLLSLPVGSTLDSQTGVFSWAPGLGFGGTHQLLFVRREAGVEQQFRVDVDIEAHSGSRQPARVVIDTPSSGAIVGQPFVVAGWAIDPAGAVSGAGIDVLHVWAHPIDGSAPRFLGVAAYGGNRPDVAALHGDRFLHSGFGIRAGGLDAGTYDVVVYGLSQATKDFSVVGLVRVTVR